MAPQDVQMLKEDDAGKTLGEVRGIQDRVLSANVYKKIRSI